MRVQSLGQEDSLEEGMATQSSILAWRIQWTEEPGGLQFVASQSWTQLKQLIKHTCTQLLLRGLGDIYIYIKQSENTKFSMI